MTRALLLLALAACHPTLTAESPAPPGRAARLDAITGFWGVTGYRLELSQGVAFAVSCTYGGPCEKLTAASDDTAIAEVRVASFSALRAAGYTAQPVAAVVIIGKAPGTTTIQLRSKAGDRSVRVTVVPPPTAVAAAFGRTPTADH